MRLRARKVWTCTVSTEKSNDPFLEIGNIVWLEIKEPGLMRPLIRRRALIISRSETPTSVTYEFQEKPQLREGFDNARTIAIASKG